MKKSIFGLVVVGATLASAIGSALPAGAVNYVYNNVTYDVTTHAGSFNDLQATLTALDNALWGNASLSEGLAGVVMGSLGYPNGFNDAAGSTYIEYIGPYFAYNSYDDAPANYFVVDLYHYAFYPNASSYSGTRSTLIGQSDATSTYAKATAVPWDISGSATILGSITGIGLGVVLRQLKNRKNIKE
jgi:hypothetical protein